jgi:hypothetical protein
MRNVLISERDKLPEGFLNGFSFSPDIVLVELVTAWKYEGSLSVFVIKHRTPKTALNDEM